MTDANCDLFQCKCACDIQVECVIITVVAILIAQAHKNRDLPTRATDAIPEVMWMRPLPLCYNSLELYAVNPRTPLSGEPRRDRR